MTQNWVVVAIVLAAVIYLAWSLWRSISRGDACCSSHRDQSGQAPSASGGSAQFFPLENLADLAKRRSEERSSAGDRPSSDSRD